MVEQPLLAAADAEGLPLHARREVEEHQAGLPWPRRVAERGGEAIQNALAVPPPDHVDYPNGPGRVRALSSYCIARAECDTVRIDLRAPVLTRAQSSSKSVP